MIFWKYFKNSCHWIFIQAPGPIAAITQGGSLILDNAREAILWLRNQFNPATCDANFIPEHARSRNIKKLPGESEKQFKARCINALLWYRRAGKRPGMIANLGVIGFSDTEIINLRHEDPERWAEFRLELPLPETVTITADDISNIDDVVNDQKPARSKLAAVRIIRERTNDIMCASVIQIHTNITVGCYVPDSSIEDTDISVQTGLIIAVKISVLPTQ